MKYEGWANRTTWAVVLWIRNEEGMLQAAKECSSAEELKRWWLDEILCCNELTPLQMDFVSTDANWSEVWDALK